jgi:peptide/nickel transport system substrate-binding protein
VNRYVKFAKCLVVAAAVALVAVLVGACGSAGSTAANGNQTTGGVVAGAIKQTGPGLTEPTKGSGARIKGGTVTFAEFPGAVPNQIFPMYSSEYCLPDDTSELSDLLYRPLYWYGNDYSPTVDYSYSIGKKPVFTNGGKTITVHLKHWMWSDGEQVSARDIVFWLNVLRADPTKNWCGTAPAHFPYNISSYRAVNPTTFQMTLNKPYNETWVIYNELSQLTPMPIAWDRTSLAQNSPSIDATSLPDTTKAGAEKVWDFLDAEGQKIATWGSSPIWRIVDGPWKVQSTTSNGGVTMVPNKSYSGTPKATISRFVQVPFTSESAMVDQIKSQGPNDLTIAYIPSQDQPLTASFKSQGYDVNMGSGYSTNFILINENAPKVGVIFKQLYARQALMHLDDQVGWIKHFLHGTAVPTLGPVPTSPPSSLVSSSSETDAYPFSVADASKLLKANGWNIVPGGQTTCAKPGTGAGECGAGIAKGQPFAFNLDYESDVESVAEEMEDYQSQAAKVGIKVNLTTHPYDDVTAEAVHCTTGAADCNWDAVNYGAGWIYGPDYYPTGDVLLESTSSEDAANYNSPKMNGLVNSTLYAKPSQERAVMNRFAKYSVLQVPYLWTPNQVGDFSTGDAGTLIDSKLGGFMANTFGDINPEAWYLTK